MSKGDLELRLCLFLSQHLNHYNKLALYWYLLIPTILKYPDNFSVHIRSYQCESWYIHLESIWSFSIFWATDHLTTVQYSLWLEVTLFSHWQLLFLTPYFYILQLSLSTYIGFTLWTAFQTCFFPSCFFSLHSVLFFLELNNRDCLILVIVY